MTKSLAVRAELVTILVIDSDSIDHQSTLLVSDGEDLSSRRASCEQLSVRQGVGDAVRTCRGEFLTVRFLNVPEFVTRRNLGLVFPPFEPCRRQVVPSQIYSSFSGEEREETDLSVPELGSLSVESVTRSIESNSAAVNGEERTFPLSSGEGDVSGEGDLGARRQASQVEGLSARDGLEKKRQVSRQPHSHIGP